MLPMLPLLLPSLLPSPSAAPFLPTDLDLLLDLPLLIPAGDDDDGLRALLAVFPSAFLIRAIGCILSLPSSGVELMLLLLLLFLVLPPLLSSRATLLLLLVVCFSFCCFSFCFFCRCLEGLRAVPVAVLLPPAAVPVPLGDFLILRNGDIDLTLVDSFFSLMAGASVLLSLSLLLILLSPLLRCCSSCCCCCSCSVASSSPLINRSGAVMMSLVQPLMVPSMPAGGSAPPPPPPPPHPWPAHNSITQHSRCWTSLLGMKRPPPSTKESGSVGPLGRPPHRLALRPFSPLPVPLALCSQRCSRTSRVWACFDDRSS
mmetsp:Transcript_38771/g.79228  ORF Transcript_38771/g.79228 Transcript_38771/m.79228 type:complete len:315 (+) Transcript_38771:1931-2875(+)